MSRYTYAYGMKSRERAEEMLEAPIADGEISEGEKPKIGRRWRITLEHGNL